MPALVDGTQYAPPLSFETETPLAGRPAGSTASDGMSLIDIWRIVMKRRWVILALTVIGAVLGSIYSATRIRLYEASSTVDVNPTATNLGLSDLIEESLSSADERMPTELAHMQSNEVVFRTIKNLAAEHKGPFPHAFDNQPANASIDSMPPADVQGMIGAVRGGLHLTTLASTNIVQVSFQSTDPIIARDVVNTLITVYFEQNLEDHVQGTGRVATWLAGRMEDMRQEASNAQARLAQFQKDHGLVGADTNDNLVVDRLRAENSQLTQLEAERIVKEAKLRQLSSDDPDLIATIGPSPTLGALRSQQIQLRSELSQYQTKFGSAYPRLQQLRQQQASVQQQIDEEIVNVRRRVQEDYQNTLHTQDLLRAKIDGEMQNVFKLNTSAAQYAVLRQDAESSRELYEALQLKLKESSIAAGFEHGIGQRHRSCDDPTWSDQSEHDNQLDHLRLARPGARPDPGICARLSGRHAAHHGRRGVDLRPAFTWRHPALPDDAETGGGDGRWAADRAAGQGAPGVADGAQFAGSRGVSRPAQLDPVECH